MGIRYEDALKKSFLAVVSGVDRAGKSTLIRDLSTRLVAWELALSKPRHLFDQSLTDEERARVHAAWLPSWTREIATVVRIYRRERCGSDGIRVLVDRSFPDEVVYARVFGRPTWSRARLGIIEALHVQEDARLIVVDATEEEIRERWDGQYDLSRALQIKSEFLSYAASAPMRAVVARSGDGEEVARWLLS